MGASTVLTATVTGCLLCQVQLTSVGSRLVLNTTLGKCAPLLPSSPHAAARNHSHRPWSVFMEMKERLPWHTSPLALVQCNLCAWPETSVYLSPNNATDRRVSLSSTGSYETD